MADRITTLMNTVQDCCVMPSTAAIQKVSRPVRRIEGTAMRLVLKAHLLIRMPRLGMLDTSTRENTDITSVKVSDAVTKMASMAVISMASTQAEATEFRAAY